MEAAWLAAQLEAGRSIESIARETGRAPSTVAYWVNKHGLSSQHAPRHRAKGGLTREQLEPLVAAGLPLRAMAEQLGVSYTTVRHCSAATSSPLLVRRASHSRPLLVKPVPTRRSPTARATAPRRSVAPRQGVTGACVAVPRR
jgi:transposase-like protein